MSNSPSNLSKSLLYDLSWITLYFSNSLIANSLAICAVTFPAFCKISRSLNCKKALEQALQNYGIKENIDKNRLFKEFVKSIRRKCSSREYIPDNLVEK